MTNQNVGAPRLKTVVLALAAIATIAIASGCSAFAAAAFDDADTDSNDRLSVEELVAFESDGVTNDAAERAELSLEDYLGPIHAEYDADESGDLNKDEFEEYTKHNHRS